MISERLKKIDWILVSAVVVLTLFGLTAIFSLDRGQELIQYPFFVKQLIAFGIGIALLFACTRFQYTFFRQTSSILYIISILLLLGVLFFGETIRGTQGWFVVAGYSFQPVELAKVAVLLHLAHFFARNRDHFRTWWFLLGSGMIVAVPVTLTLMQPDAGSALLMVAAWAVMVFISGIRRVQFTVFIILALTVAISSWIFFLADYQKDRIRTFFDPGGDPLGRGYNVNQSIIAVGSGGVFGKGLGYGSQSQLRFLPEARTDFVFATIAEELGFVGSLVVLTLLMTLWIRLLQNAQVTADDFGVFVVIGFLTISLLQTAVNVGMNMGLVPVTGIGLPFVSYGGSGLVAQYLMIGIVLSVVMQVREKRGFVIG